MQVINTHQAKTYLSKLIDDVTRGQEIIIGRAGTPVARLVPYIHPTHVRVGGQLTGKIKIAKDFDKLPAKFSKYFSN